MLWPECTKCDGTHFQLTIIIALCHCFQTIHSFADCEFHTENSKVDYMSYVILAIYVSNL